LGDDHGRVDRPARYRRCRMSAAYLTVRETTDLLGVDHKAVRREIERGRLPGAESRPGVSDQPCRTR
jgi:IS30 family transposase